MPKKIHLWGDGSSVNNGEEKGLGGYGYVLLYGDFSNADLDKEYGDKTKMLTGWDGFLDTTNQREEIKAIINGLKRIRHTDIPIEVFSDSAYLVNCMKKRWYSEWRMNGWMAKKRDKITKEIIGEEPVVSQDLWEELLDIIEDGMLQIKFNKVKGHSGIFYNEMCDTLARQGLEKVREMRVSV